MGEENVPAPGERLNHGAQDRPHGDAKDEGEDVAGQRQHALVVVQEEVGGDAVGGVLEGAADGAGNNAADDERGKVVRQRLRDEKYGKQYITSLSNLISQRTLSFSIERQFYQIAPSHTVRVHQRERHQRDERGGGIPRRDGEEVILYQPAAEIEFGGDVLRGRGHGRGVETDDKRDEARGRHDGPFRQARPCVRVTVMHSPLGRGAVSHF